ncbi:hypothetical protein RhiirB3_495196 [Rhizophagus irregularis]|nr:hypothetical protein RhiirB3_495196 [Rhizophagus irregularis]
MTFMPLSYNYIMIIYVKSNNGVKGKYGLIINYDSKIISEIYLGSVNEYITDSVISKKGFICIGEYDKRGKAAWHWFSAPDITTGKVVELGSGEFSVPNLLSYTFVNSFNFSLIDGGFGYAYILKYEEEMGSLVSNNPNIQYWKIYVSFLREGTYSPTTPSLVYQTTTKLNNNNGNYKSGGSFGPEFVHYNMFRRNGTLLGIKKQTGNKLEILLKPLLRLNNQGAEYNNPAIESTKPAVNEVIDPLINEITIKYGIPLNDDPYKPSLLRQTISGDSKLCTIGSDNHTVHIPIFSSTFNQPNSSYYVVVDNNFVISQERNEPLLGIIKKTWMISTSNIHIFF